MPANEGKTEEFEVYDFEGAGGVALSMYNTDEVMWLVLLLLLILCYIYCWFMLKFAVDYKFCWGIHGYGFGEKMAPLFEHKKYHHEKIWWKVGLLSVYSVYFGLKVTNS